MFKEAVQVNAFHSAYPQFRGQGVRIAVFDAGIDPAAKGLQQTCSGERKIANLIDCSGSGDVDTRTVVTIQPDRTVQGLSGRTLQLNEAWNIPSGTVHLGLKRVTGLWPLGVIEMYRAQRKQALTLEVNKATTALFQHLPDRKISKGSWNDNKELLTQLDYAVNRYEEPGPLLDCVVFHDGACWRAIVNVKDSSDLRDLTPLTDYASEYQYMSFGVETMLNFSVNILDDGNLLSIVTTASGHGTHVASIIAAHFPDEPERDGVAPGAVIVSCKISDTRLETMEVGLSVHRAMKEAVRNNCQVVNMSFGEPTRLPQSGHIIDIAAKIAKEYGITFVASLGNAGPALSTVGAPGGTAIPFLGVAAYLPSEAGRSLYSFLDDINNDLYTFSSRGPTEDGDFGACVCAPGGALAAVPQWTMTALDVKNGTSMATPCVTGCVALLLSYHHQQSTELINRHLLVRRAIENTAAAIVPFAPSAVETGHGLIQVMDACHWMTAYIHDHRSHLFFNVRVDDVMRGIYIRDVIDHDGVYYVTVQQITTPTTKTPMCIRLHSRVAWVRVDPHVWINDENFTKGYFNIHVLKDITATLQPGVHVTHVDAFIDDDVTQQDNIPFGAVFRVPITFIQPHFSSSSSSSSSGSIAWQEQIQLHQGLHRRFFVVPSWAQTAVCSILCTNQSSSPIRIVLHGQHAGHHDLHKEVGTRHYFTFNEHLSRHQQFCVTRNSTWELCFGVFWATPGQAHLDLTIRFYGLSVAPSSVMLTCPEAPQRVDIQSLRNGEQIIGNGQLTTIHKQLRPSETSITPMNEWRDAHEPGSVPFQLVLTYSFRVNETSYIIVRPPLMASMLYDSPLLSYMALLFDDNKRYLGTVDVKAEPIKLFKGDVIIRIQLCHLNFNVLDRLRQIGLVVEIPLTKPVALNVANSPDRLPFAQDPELSMNKTMRRGERCSLWVSSEIDDKVQKLLEPGNVLVGKLKLTRSGDIADVITEIAVMSVVMPSRKKDTGSEGESKYDECAELVKSLRKMYQKGQTQTETLKLRQKCLSLNESYLPLHLLHLDLVVTRSDLLGIVSAADVVLSHARPIARQQPSGKSRKSKAQQDSEVADAMTEALFQKAIALIALVAERVELEQTVNELLQWASLDQPRLTHLRILLAMGKGHQHAQPGLAMKLLHAQAGQTISHTSDKTSELLQELYQSLGWTLLARAEGAWRVLRRPHQFMNF